MSTDFVFYPQEIRGFDNFWLVRVMRDVVRAETKSWDILSAEDEFVYGRTFASRDRLDRVRDRDDLRDETRP